jgi:Protein of unknown function (DUF2946)
MQPIRLRLGAIAAWLGVIALSLDALVPVHLAFDLAHTFETATHREDSSAAEHDFIWRLLALVTGHQDADSKAGGHDKRHREHCAVCSSLGTLAGCAPAATAALSVPIRVETPILLAAIAAEPPAAPATAYRSRAPPIAIG